MMQIKKLSYHYKGCPEVLKDVSFDMEPGQFLAILGNNGVGKSTLLKCFNHILKPDAGEVLLDGENLLKCSGREVAKRVATDLAEEEFDIRHDLLGMPLLSVEAVIDKALKNKSGKPIILVDSADSPTEGGLSPKVRGLDGSPYGGAAEHKLPLVIARLRGIVGESSARPLLQNV